MNKSNTISKLAKALAEAQAEMPSVKMNATNPFLKTKYADLGAVIETSKPILAKNGLSVSQFPTSQEGRIGVTSILMHESGEFVEDTITLVPDSGKGLSANQSAGVTISYLRRYAWAAILGLYADEDVDGDALHADTKENAEASDTVATMMKKRDWTNEQLDVIAKGDLNRDDANDILSFSTLPADAPVKTVDSWFKHYIKSNGTNVMEKADDANKAYADAKKKSNGGK